MRICGCTACNAPTVVLNTPEDGTAEVSAAMAVSP